jgi:hypothetical protein
MQLKVVGAQNRERGKRYTFPREVQKTDVEEDEM